MLIVHIGYWSQNLRHTHVLQSKMLKDIGYWLHGFFKKSHVRLSVKEIFTEPSDEFSNYKYASRIPWSILLVR